MPLPQGSRRTAMLSGAAALVLAATLPAAFPMALAQTAPAPPPLSCAPEGDLHFLCGIGAPEDLTVLPGTNWIVSGSFAPDATGGLYAVDSAHPMLTRLYPAPTAKARPGLET